MSTLRRQPDDIVFLDHDVIINKLGQRPALHMPAPSARFDGVYSVLLKSALSGASLRTAADVGDGWGGESQADHSIVANKK